MCSIGSNVFNLSIRLFYSLFASFFYFFQRKQDVFLPAASTDRVYGHALAPPPGYHGNRGLTSLRTSAPDPGVDRERGNGEAALPHLRMRAPAPLLPAVNLIRPWLFRRDLSLTPSETAPRRRGVENESNKRQPIPGHYDATQFD